MDDQSVPVQGPALEMPEIDDEQQALIEDQNLAKPFYSDKWQVVEDMFIEAITQARDVTSLDSNLIADEYKIEALSNMKYASRLQAMLDSIKEAVNAVEQTKQGGK